MLLAKVNMVIQIIGMCGMLAMITNVILEDIRRGNEEGVNK